MKLCYLNLLHANKICNLPHLFSTVKFEVIPCKKENLPKRCNYAAFCYCALNKLMACIDCVTVVYCRFSDHLKNRCIQDPQGATLES